MGDENGCFDGGDEGRFSALVYKVTDSDFRSMSLVSRQGAQGIFAQGCLQVGSRHSGHETQHH